MTMRKAGSLVKCDFCGGPAVWCVIGGDLCYHCRHQCDGFMQLELWDEDGVASSMRGGDGDDVVYQEENELPF